MRVDKDGAMDASAGEQSTRVELDDEAKAEVVELMPRADDADPTRSYGLYPKRT